MNAVIPILSAKRDELPSILLDGDSSERQLASHLRSDLYAANGEGIFIVDDHLQMAGAEIEDLVPNAVD